MSILDTLDKYVKIAPWLQHVGLMLVFGGLVLQRWHPEAGTYVAYLGAGISSTGFVYAMIYP